ncbi:hypothetical protein LTR36_005089 [Oleoguttula mirabilis]|uniref:Spherulin-4 n=1 Tax=Oleoguttula mirabilis TaxID=1507867 RepID=A0AAV9JVR5_9PEZI|nr:hypothetical protein LTR36_005089 [Oleoguttula mirabilis]
MVNYGFVLVPMYIYPTPGAWDPLFSAAKANPNVTFQAVINPWDGPGAGSCPDTNFINATSYLNAISNIKTLAYVHTANQYDCGPYGNWICPCSQPLSALEANITTYQNWPTASCSTNNAKDIHIDGIFFDEAPTDGNCTAYMQNATAFAKTTLTHGNTVLFNPGGAVNASYWSIADYINVFEDSEAAYDIADIGALDGQGAYRAQSTMIIYGDTDESTTLHRDVNTILSSKNDDMAGLYITDKTIYSEFPGNWTGFVSEVAAVVKANMGS